VLCPSPIGIVRDLRWSVLATVGGRPRTNVNETKKETVPGRRPHHSIQDFREPMLYPLSYEGLRCTFTKQSGRVLVCRARAGCLAPDGQCRICAACREPADPLPPSRPAGTIVRWVVPSQEPEAGGATR
jgi:hypothetical protein